MPFPFELKGDKIKNCPHVEAAESESSMLRT